MKKLKLKKWVWITFIIILFTSIFIYAGLNIKKENDYKKTIEYQLITKGYTKEEVSKLLEVFSTEEEHNYLLNTEKNSGIISLIEEKYFKKDNLTKYLDYMQEFPKLDSASVVRNINIHLDQEFYSLALNTDYAKEELMLVNKYYLINADYNPSDLVTISQDYSWGSLGSKKIRRVAYDAFLDMWNQAYLEGYYLMVNSAYRTYQEQETIYNQKKKSEGTIMADKVAARPGASEHQSGLALDIFSKTNNNQKTFAETDTAKWLQDNAHKYGFILRYPSGKESITGYQYEAWHYRYVGIEAATYIYENDITFDEYYAYFIEK